MAHNAHGTARCYGRVEHISPTRVKDATLMARVCLPLADDSPASVAWQRLVSS